MRKADVIVMLVTVLVVAALLLPGCGKTTAPTTTAPPTMAPATTAAPTTAPPTTSALPTTTALRTTAPPVTTAPPTPTAAPSDMVTVALTKLDGTKMQKTVRKPQYGGTLAYVPSEPLGFDDLFSPTAAATATTTSLTNDRVAAFDWTLGMGGTGERSWLSGASIAPSETTRPTSGSVAEKFEFTDPNTVKITIRKGIRYALNPNSEAAKIANGREMTADDVVFSLWRNWLPGNISDRNYPGHLILDETKALDRYTLQVKWAPGKIATSWFWATTTVNIVPREAVEKLGDLRDWKNAVGSGPFILTDYVKASSATFVRNPNFWMKDPFFTENQLPYLDSVTQYYIVDPSTREAALRTARIDVLRGLTIDSYKSLTKTTPELKVVEMPGTASTVFMRVDQPGAPWNDKRVRQALQMAIDSQTIKSQFYSGYAVWADYPVLNLPEYSAIYIPLTSLPAAVQELYQYNPDKAKQLLAEAGYPSGFQAEVLTTQDTVDWLQIVQSYWAKVGVDLKIDVKEAGVVQNMRNFRKYTQMISGSVGSSVVYMRWNLGKAAWANYSMAVDPVVDDAYDRMDAAWPDQAMQGQILKTIIPYALEQRWWTVLPAPNSFVLFWPWLANYHGEAGQGMSSGGELGMKYLWVDQALKKKMGK